MRIAATADLHGFLPPVPACDVLVIAGDITPATDHSIAFQQRWLDQDLRAWLDAAPAKHIVAIAGNHDFIFERAPGLVPTLPWTVLQDRSATIDGVTFWGSPWTPWFFDWAFNAPRGDAGETFLSERYATVPPACDVAVVHGPPAGYGDRTARGQAVGSTAFLQLIDTVKPSLALFGHIHEAQGVWQHGPTHLANVSAVDLDYRLVEEPIRVFDLAERS